MDKTGVIILHYKDKGITLDCLKSIFSNQNKKKPGLIIVVGNSIDRTFSESLTKIYPQIILISNDTNEGFSKANNRGITKAIELGCEDIILLNNDTIVSDDLFSQLTAFSRKNREIGLISPKIYFAAGYEYHKHRYKEKEKGKVLWYAGGVVDNSNIYASHRGVDEVEQGQYDQIAETDFATGCCILIKKEVVMKIGLLDENYFMYFEDLDYSVRARSAGFRVVYFPKVHLWHKNAVTSGHPGSETHIYYQTRNRLYFGFKYASFNSKKSLFIDSIRLLSKGGIYSKAVKDYYFNKMGKGNS